MSYVSVHDVDDVDQSGLHEDAIVISGMSGLMPSCENLQVFSDKLYDKVNMVEKDNFRWSYTHPEIPDHFGKIPKLERFDAQFFMMHYRLVHCSDPMIRKLVEASFEAIFDAGVTPSGIVGRKRMGVFVSVGTGETEKALCYKDGSYGMMGCNRAMMANRISYFFNSTSPSVTVEAGSCSSILALSMAYDSIVRGDCECAIVGNSSIALHPQTYVLMKKQVLKNTDGKTKCYDVNADGNTLSESINVFFLQKYKHSKRVYAELRHADTIFSKTLEPDSDIYGFWRKPGVVNKFLQKFYETVGVPPSLVEYVEGNGMADPKSDKFELELLEDIFCKDRKKPLMVGSVTSNIGDTDVASGGCGLIKMLLAYQKGKMAANINCENPREDVTALRDGSMRILTENEHFGRSFAALSRFSDSGVSGHALFQGHFKPKDLSKYYTDLPYLVTISARKETGIAKILDSIKSHTLDAEEIGLLHSVFKKRISNHLARGYGIFASNENKETVTLTESIDHYDDAKRPLWFVYSGMGSQWNGMGVQLLKIPVFAAAIDKCDKVLAPKGIDIRFIITSPDKSIFDNILYSFVGIAAVQIGLTDLMRSIGLIPDRIIGHSVGELGCAYCDGTVTAEQMILLSYSRGLVSTEVPFIRGSMAAVGIGYNQIRQMLPAEIDVACRNAPDSSTLSGPSEVMAEFVAKLTSQGIFAKEVKCSNIAYHSRYIADGGPPLLKCCSEIVKEPKARSSKWLSTSVPQEKWDESYAKYSSAEYHTNNLLNPVLFENVLRMVPHDAVLVEIAPHSLLQAILKRALPTTTYISLTSRTKPDGILNLLEALGNIFKKGYEINVGALYPKIQYPVSTETRSLSHLVEWAHDETWDLPSYISDERKHASFYNPIITVHDEEFQYLSGHIIEGVRVYPFAAALVHVWDTLAMTIGKPRLEVSVQFHDLHFVTQPPILDHRPLNITVSLQRGSGKFEVSYDHGGIVAEGIILAALSETAILTSSKDNSAFVLNNSDVYKIFYGMGLEYVGQFRSILSINSSMSQAQIAWDNNWVTLIDGVFQLNNLKQCSELSQPLYVKYMSIDVVKHDIEVHECIEANVYDHLNTTRCGGLILKHITFKKTPTPAREIDVMKTLKFFPYIQEDNMDVSTVLYVFIQIIAQYLDKTELKIIYVETSNSRKQILDEVNSMTKCHPKIKLNVVRVTRQDMAEKIGEVEKPNAVFFDHLLRDKRIFEEFYNVIPIDTFVINMGVDTENLYPNTLYRPISIIGKHKNRLELVKWRPLITSLPTSVMTVRNNYDLERFQNQINNLSRQKIVVLSPYPLTAGLKKVVEKAKRESNCSQLYVAMINNRYLTDYLEHIPNFDLTFNLLEQGKWGGEYYMFLNKTGKRGKNITLKSSHLGDINSLFWSEIPELKDNDLRVTVYYAGLNTLDAKIASAEISNDYPSGYGMDFSGVTRNGVKVMGLISGGAASSQVYAKRNLLWPVPKHWSMEDAVTVPLPYCLAFYCLAIKCKLVPGMNVLIHGGSGALGQAAISIALANQCRVFTTVSDVHKKKFLRQIFPDLPAERIGCSRDGSFSLLVLNATKGEGCNIIISCVNGSLKSETLKCCAFAGTTIDTVQIPSKENFSYGMSFMTKSRSYIPIDFRAIFVEENLEVMQKLQLLVTEGISRGWVRPLSRVTFRSDEAPRALRLLATSRHRGRVLLKMDEGANNVQPRITCTPNKYQLIISDNDGFGIKLADKLIDEGAKKLHLHFSELSSFIQKNIMSWRNSGLNIEASFKDLSKKENVQHIFDRYNRYEVESIYFINLDGADERAQSALNNLDVVSRKMCSSLKYFSVLVDGDEFGKDLCLNRKQQELPAMSLQLHKLKKFNKDKTNKNAIVINEDMRWKTALDLLNTALNSRDPVIIASSQPVEYKPLLQQIERISGVQLGSATPNSTLEQLGIDEGRHLDDICRLLELEYNVNVSREELVGMTITKIIELQQDNTCAEKEPEGLAAYFDNIETDEITSNAEYILMSTRIHGSEMRLYDFDESKAYLCIVPGLEGYYKRFQLLCQRLKIAAIVLQSDLVNVKETVQEMAQQYVEVMIKLKMRKRFHLLGYEFGVLVAIEMASILESYGFTGKVYCLGGSPEEICSSIKNDLKNNEKEAQDALIDHMYTLITNTIPENTNWSKFATWDEKVNKLVNATLGKTPLTMQYVKAIVNVAYSRIKATFKYSSNLSTLKSEIIIIKPAKSQSVTKKFKSLSQKAITEYELNASPYHLANDLYCTSIINNHLDPEILEAFSSYNLCSSYIVDNSSGKKPIF